MVLTTTEALYRIWEKREEIGFGTDFDPEVLAKLCKEENVKEDTYLKFAERKEAEQFVQENLDLKY